MVTCLPDDRCRAKQRAAAHTPHLQAARMCSKVCNPAGICRRLNAFRGDLWAGKLKKKHDTFFYPAYTWNVPYTREDNKQGGPSAQRTNNTPPESATPRDDDDTFFDFR